MADPGDSEVREVFARFRAETSSQLPPPDLSAVRGRARRRQVNRRAMLSVAALALLAVPAVGYRLAGDQVGPDLPPGPAQQVSGAPTERPTESPTSAASTSSATIQRAVTRADIMAATLTVPAWPEPWDDDCPSGEVKVDKSRAGQPLTVGKVVAADVDRDGDDEAVAIFSCGYEAGADQVLAVGRNEQGELRTFGRVVVSAGDEPVKDVVDLRPGRDGTVDVLVADMLNQNEEAFAEKQWRTYRWNGRQFGQSAGPREFTPVAPSTDLGVTVSTTPFGAPADGAWAGGVTVTVKNSGPNRAEGVYLDVYVTGGDGRPLGKQLKVTPECALTDVKPDGKVTGVHLVCHQPALAVGAERSSTFQVRLPTANGARDLNVSVFVYAEQPGVRVLNDTGPLTNSAILTLAAPTQ